MPTKVKEWLIRCTLLAGSLASALLMSEVYFRSIEYLDTAPLYPEFASQEWERVYLKDYSGFRKQRAVGNDLSGYIHDPELGWDSPSRVRGERGYDVERRLGNIRVVAIGDSYTYGAEVETGQTYPAYLERKLGAGDEVLNMGVKAYGIDQAVLKYLKYGRKYRPDVVVFGIFGPDYVRTPLTFYRFSKPSFRLDNCGKLILTNTPVPHPEEVYRQLRAGLWPLKYTSCYWRIKRYSNDTCKILTSSVGIQSLRQS